MTYKVTEGRSATVTARVSAAEFADWRAKAAAVGVPLSALLRQAMVRTRTWTALGSPADPRGLRIPRWE